MQTKLNDVEVGAVDVSLNAMKLINQIQLWEHTGSDDNDGYNDDGASDMMKDLNSIRVTTGNVSTNVPSGQGNLIDDANFALLTAGNNGFVNMNALTDGSMNTCFGFGMKQKSTTIR